MRTRRYPSTESSPCNGGLSGSAVIMALFACMVACVCVQMLTTAVVCGNRALLDESLGRDSLHTKDACLAALKERSSKRWTTTEWEPFGVVGNEVGGRLVEREEGGDWVLGVEVAESVDSASTKVGALVERGRDGLDLPRAALVADRVVATPGRSVPWTSVPDADVVAYTFPVEGEEPQVSGCVFRKLAAQWELGVGWRRTLLGGSLAEDSCVIVEAEEGQVVMAPDEVADASVDNPVLLVAVGGGDLDLRGTDELWGVVVVDQGSLLAECTTIHGATYVSEDLVLGSSGQVVFDEGIWQWARDRAITRTRLVPGSRWEGTE